MAKLVDFHCHLDLYPDFEGAVAECERDGVYTLAVTTTPRAWPRNQELASSSQHVRPALGLHPQVVGERSQEIALWEKYAGATRYIGEVGLDAGPRHRGSLHLQKQIFERVLRVCAEQGSKILSVHSVRSADMVLEMVESLLPSSRGRVVLHWFSGSKREARRAVELGCFFSINLPMLQSDRGRKLVAALPKDRLLTETDGPFTNLEDRPARPSDVKVLLRALANLRSEPSERTTELVWRNLRALLS